MNYLCLDDFRQLPDAVILNPPAGSELSRPTRGISIDSRSLKAGQIFWALKGERFDAHDFIIDAVKNGAAAAVVDQSHAHTISGMGAPVIVVKNTLLALQTMAGLHRKNFSIPVIAITGTNGKTTTKEMLAWILQTKYAVHKTWGNLNNQIGVPLTLLHLTSAHQVSIIEMGTNHPGEISFLSSLVQPTIGLITNIGRGHLEFFHSIEGVAREKLSLFEKIQEKGLIVINQDDELLAAYPASHSSCCSYSLHPTTPADVHGECIDLNDQGEGIWKLNGHTTIRLGVAGLHNVQNALAASTVALRFGFHEQEIKSVLEKYSSYDKRMQIINQGGCLIINDSYNANPDSFVPAVKTLVHIAGKQSRRKIAVLGDMLELGENSVALHRELLQLLRSSAIDSIFTLGEIFSKAVRDLKAQKSVPVVSFTSHQELATALKKFVQPHDVILIKGSRGMQMEKILAFL
jgi:UDP-N-acetylmuramoyl-tripeptide--D-alanyl-D-alanine ligase